MVVTGPGKMELVIVGQDFGGHAVVFFKLPGAAQLLTTQLPAGPVTDPEPRHLL